MIEYNPNLNEDIISPGVYGISDVRLARSISPFTHRPKTVEAKVLTHDEVTPDQRIDDAVLSAVLASRLPQPGETAKVIPSHETINPVLITIHHASSGRNYRYLEHKSVRILTPLN